MKTYKENVVELDPGDNLIIRTARKVVGDLTLPQVEISVHRVTCEDSAPFEGPFLQVHFMDPFREILSFGTQSVETSHGPQSRVVGASNIPPSHGGMRSPGEFCPGVLESGHIPAHKDESEVID